MDHFNYDADGQLQAEQLPLQQLADQYGTPLYVYSRATLERHWHAFDQAAGDIPHLICYAVKANSNLALLNLLARLGSGFDIVSGGELSRVLAAGGDPAKVVFSGVAKSEAEMRLALEKEILCFNLESEAELERLNRVAGSMGKKARVSVRVNPDIDAGTHPYISTGLKQNKFGIDASAAREVFRRAAGLPNLAVRGIDCHIGSQLTKTAPFAHAIERLRALIDGIAADGIELSLIDIGGGLGIDYGKDGDAAPPSHAEYGVAVAGMLGQHGDEVVGEDRGLVHGQRGVVSHGALPGRGRRGTSSSTSAR